MNAFKKIIVISLFFVFSANGVFAQNTIAFDFSDPVLTEGKTIRLEAFEYKPFNWNGKVVLMSHGSTGGKKDVINTSLKYLNISKEVTNAGYIFVTYMRKGRGNSEGVFTEETGRCDRTNLQKEQREAELQIAQVIDQVKQKYKVPKLVLMGHSRGGFLSSTYAGKNPESVSAVVNLAGAWSAVCETKNGGFGKSQLEASAKNFKKQLWAYFENDSYFSPEKFNDPDYVGLRSVADANGLTFGKFTNAGVADGHSTPLLKPFVWTKAMTPFLSSIE